MNWYIAKLIFRIISGDGNHNAQFDEQLRLIAADNEALAIEKANAIGTAGQDSFLNAKKETVRWEFIGVTEVNSVVTLTDGAEIYYRLREVDDADAHIEAIQRKADLLNYPVRLV
jgi:hypothetical protein